MKLGNEFYKTESQRQARMEQKKQEELEKGSEVLQEIKYEQAEQKAYEKLLFCYWYLLDKELRKLEDLRDKNEPKSADEEWNEEFCYAIQSIPEVKKMCEELWFAYTNINRPDYEKYV